MFLDCTNHIIQIHVKLPAREIVTFSLGIGLIIAEILSFA